MPVGKISFLDDDARIFVYTISYSRHRMLLRKCEVDPLWVEITMAATADRILLLLLSVVNGPSSFVAFLCFLSSS
jgi:hypothetical protein